jgi:hypothetical protein
MGTTVVSGVPIAFGVPLATNLLFGNLDHVLAQKADLDLTLYS